MSIPTRQTSSKPESRHPDEEQPVVIADGDAENASHVERQLRRAGVRQPIVVFRNGDDLHTYLTDAALREASAPCVLFLDPRMPGANGYDPVRWVKRETLLSEMMVVIFSNGEEPGEAECAAELGLEMFMKKRPDLPALASITDFLNGTVTDRATG